MYKKVIQNIGVRVINYNIICLKILYVLLCSCMFNIHTNVGLTAWFNNLQNTAMQTLTIVLIIFNKGLTNNVTRTRYEVITHVYKGYHSAFFLIIHFMNENIFKPRHTCTKIQLIFFSHRDRYNENKHTCCFRFEQTAHPHTDTVTVSETKPV